MASGFGLFWCSSSTGWYTSNHISQKRGFAQGSNRIGSVRRLLCGFFRLATTVQGCNVRNPIQKNGFQNGTNKTTWLQDSTSRLPKHTKQFCWRTVPQRISQLLMVWNYQGHFFIMIAESLRYQSFCFGTPVDLGQWFPPNLEKQKYLMKNTSGSGATWTLDLVFGSSFCNSLTWTTFGSGEPPWFKYDLDEP